MENTVEKLGLYDLFGVLIPGIVINVIGLTSGISFFNPKEYIDNDVIVVIIFVLECYILGIILQELSSIIDKKILKTRRKSRSTYIINENIIDNENEREDVIKIANKILEKDIHNKSFTEKECDYVYIKCKSFLEINNMIGKSERINSLYALGRGLLISSVIFGSISLYKVVLFYSNQYLFLFVISCAVIWLLWRRMKMYSEYNIRVVFRHYVVLKELEIKNSKKIKN